MYFDELNVWREGSVIEPLRWFWRNSSEARDATGECLSREAIVENQPKDVCPNRVILLTSTSPHYIPPSVLPPLIQGFVHSHSEHCSGCSCPPGASFLAPSLPCLPRKLSVACTPHNPSQPTRLLSTILLAGTLHGAQLSVHPPPFCVSLLVIPWHPRQTLHVRAEWPSKQSLRVDRLVLIEPDLARAHHAE